VLLAATPHLVRAGTRSRRLRPKRPEQAVPLAWNEIRDLGTDYGLPAAASETPRAYSARFRETLLGEPGGMDQDAHDAVASLTSAFEHHRYGRPDDGGTQSAGSAQGGSLRTNTAGADIAAGVTAVEASLRANATMPRRLAAAWLPPSVTRRLGLLLRKPFRAAGRAMRTARHPVVRFRSGSGTSATRVAAGRPDTHDGGRGAGGR